jgi:hypothetical protein
VENRPETTLENGSQKLAQAQQDPVRSRCIALVLALVAAGFYVGTFLFWVPRP